MITVRDVEASSQWLQSIFSLKSAHGGPEFDMLADAEEKVILWIHRSESDHDHPQTRIDQGQPGIGVVLYFLVDDIDAVCEQARSMGAEFVEDLHLNPLAHHREFTIKSPDGYFCAAHTVQIAKAK